MLPRHIRQNRNETLKQVSIIKVNKKPNKYEFMRITLNFMEMVGFESVKRLGEKCAYRLIV